MNLPMDDFRSWLESKNLKRRTVKEYLYYFIRFLPYGGLTQESVGKFLIECNNKMARSFLMHFRKYILTNHKKLGINPDLRIEISEIELPTLSGRNVDKLIRPLTEEQVLEIEKFLHGEMEKLQLLMSYYGGLRLGELHGIKILSFNWDEWKKDMEKVGECKVFGKGSKEGIAFFPSSLMKRIASFIHASNYQSLSSYLFLKGVDYLTTDMRGRFCRWSKTLKKAAIDAGIIKFDDKGKMIPETNVHPHRLRHSWGFHLKNVKKLDIRDIQEILRHSSITSTQRYTYVDKSHLKGILTKDVFNSKED